MVVIVALILGVGAAYLAKNLQSSSQTANKPGPVEVSPSFLALSPSPSASPTATPSPTPAPASPTPSAAPTASKAPSAAPSAAPRPSPPPPGPAPYPPEISAGSRYSYSGSGGLIAEAIDNQDVGSSICGGINESTQAFPSGYEGAYYVSVAFPDGNILSAGYLRYGSGARQDFAEVERNGVKYGGAGGATTPGSHTYCVSHSASGWSFTDDGAPIGCSGCPGEPASNTRGASLRFANTIQRFQGQSGSFALIIPGFHDISVSGQAPTQLTGRVQPF
jgi:hypothetical protein